MIWHDIPEKWGRGALDFFLNYPSQDEETQRSKIGDWGGPRLTNCQVSVFRRACLGVLSWSLGVEERKQAECGDASRGWMLDAGES